MRSHSSLPIFASHRARPHCGLSLATASASSRVAKSHDDTEAMDVDLEPPAALVAFSEELPAWKVVDGVPFPSHSGKSPRKHALLRSSAPLLTSISTNAHDSSESGSPTAEHQPPPRKRTRTSALLQPPVKPHRSPRVQSLPIRPSRLPRSASSLLFLPRTKEPVPPNPAEDPFTYAFPTSSMPTMPQSALLDLISCLIIPASLDYPSLKPSIPLPRRRKPFSGGTVFLRNVYKSVLYGLALKYSVTDSLQPAQVYQGTSRNTARSSFDIQDALLADRLRCHLTLHGEDINTLTFEIEKMDNHSPSLPVSSQGNPSSSIPIMSYERLVSLTLLQRSLEARSKPLRKGPTCRKPSNLSESYTIDID